MAAPSVVLVKFSPEKKQEAITHSDSPERRRREEERVTEEEAGAIVR